MQYCKAIIFQLKINVKISLQTFHYPQQNQQTKQNTPLPHIVFLSIEENIACIEHLFLFHF